MRTHSARPNLRFQSEAQRLRLLARMAEEAEMIGGRIRELREDHAWTQRELAEKMEGHAEGKDISRWENGKHVPEPSNLKALAKALGTTIADLRAGSLAERQEPKPGDLDRLNADGVELRMLDAKLDRVLGRVAELAGSVGKMQKTQQDLQARLRRLDHRTGEPRNG